MQWVGRIARKAAKLQLRDEASRLGWRMETRATVYYGETADSARGKRVSCRHQGLVASICVEFTRGRQFFGDIPSSRVPVRREDACKICTWALHEAVENMFEQNHLEGSNVEASSKYRRNGNYHGCSLLCTWGGW